MQVAIDLDEAHHGVYTNLDYVQGKVILRLPATAPIVNITVKLEGESQTLITPPQNQQDERRPRPVHELHKILYDTQIVFPDKEIPGSTHYTLPPGQYLYPFRFKIPFNSTCHNTVQKSLPSFPQYIKHPPPINAAHIKAPLPPTLGGFPGLASIRYYVKVTVNRKEFYKENPRQLHHISFVPIEPPRPPPSSTENYGRRTYQFPPTGGPSAAPGNPDKAPSLRKVFSGLKLNRSNTGSTTASSLVPEQTPRIEVDARLPDPAIITPLQRVPLRILIKRLDNGHEPLYLQTLQVEIVGQTSIRAGQWNRNEPTSWILTSHTNMNELLTFPSSGGGGVGLDSASVATPVPLSAAESKAAEATMESAGPSSPTSARPVTPSEKTPAQPPPAPSTGPTPAPMPAPAPTPSNRPRTVLINQEYWTSPVPATVAPSFRTCNIGRTYSIDVRVGIGHGPASARNQIVLPLRLHCDVYSAITPPPSLLAAVANKPRPPQRPITKKPLSAQAQQNAAAAAKQQAAAAQASAAGVAGPSSAPGPAPVVSAMAEDGEEPPPSYEDAMAHELQPVDGPRTYRPAPAPADEGFPTEKRRGSG